MRITKSFNLGFFLLVCLMQFPIRFQSCTWLTYIFIYLIPGIYLLLNYKWLLGCICRVLETRAKAFLCFFYLLFISVLWPLIRGTHDFSFLSDWWFKLCLLLVKNIFLLAVYENYIARSEMTAEVYISYYLYAVAAYVLFSLVLIVLPDLRSLCIEHLYLTAKERIDIQNPSYQTRIGWSGWAGFDVTMQCAVAVALAAILIIIDKNEIKKQVKYLCFLCVALIGTMLYGRTGLLASLVILFFAGIYLVIKKQWRFLLLCVFIVAIGVFALLLISNHFSGVLIWFKWAFTFIINFFTKGTLDDGIGSTQVLFDRMYWLPSIKTVLFGDAFFTQDGHYYMSTDSGIMRLTLYYGVVHYLLGLLAGLAMISLICKKFRADKPQLSKMDTYIVFFLIAICTVVFEIKGEAYYKVMAIILPMALLGKNIDCDLHMAGIAAKYNMFSMKSTTVDKNCLNNDHLSFADMENKTISVIMSVYNETATWLKESTLSILNQTYSAIEFVIIVDNPELDDEKKQVLMGFASDPRVVLLWNDTNLGLASSLNRGIHIAKGAYIARMDADDIALPDRLEKEILYLQSNNYDMVSTNKINIDESGKVLYSDGHLNESALKGLLYSNIIVHPSVLIRAEVIKSLGGYRKLINAEDFDLWLRMLDAGYSIGILDEYLMLYRLRANSASVGRQLEQFYVSQYIRNLSYERMKRGTDSFSTENMNCFLKEKPYDDKTQSRYAYAKKYLEAASQQRDKKKYVGMFMNILKSGILFPQLIAGYIKKYFLVKSDGDVRFVKNVQ